MRSGRGGKEGETMTVWGWVCITIGFAPMAAAAYFGIKGDAERQRVIDATRRPGNDQWS
jgi:hypothetical protein